MFVGNFALKRIGKYLAPWPQHPDLRQLFDNTEATTAVNAPLTSQLRAICKILKLLA
jgi:hypothetical protein